MANVFKPKRSGTELSVPTTGNLVDGEIAVNYTDQKIYIHNGTNVVQVANANLLHDTTPQLGGELDLNNNSITGTGGVSITGIITATGNIQTDGAFRAESSNSTERFQIEYNETTDSLDFSYFAS